MIKLPPTSTLLPERHALPSGGEVSLFRSPGTELLKLDLLFEAGSAYQPQRLCASAATKMLTVASPDMDSAELAEFMDFRGVVLDPNNEVLQSTVSIYMLRRFAGEVLPVVALMLECQAFKNSDFEVWQRKKESEVAAMEQQSKHIARRMFYHALFGENHPLGRYATAADVPLLDPDTVRYYLRARFSGNLSGIVLSGDVDNRTTDLLGDCFAHMLRPASDRIAFEPLPCRKGLFRTPMDNSVQASIRIGRLLPFTWEHTDYPVFMIITTLLGGYFGSRLMSNLREAKGYTYGVFARTQIYRGVIVFFVAADVAAGAADSAVEQVMMEMQRLRNEEVTDEELQLVKTVLVGDFLRSVDGVFERSQRFCDMLGTDVDERFTDLLRDAIERCTPADIRRVAEALLDPDAMTVCVAGAL